ncbi:hypothetical protein [Catellatospora sp. TT07R-123]|nr:hypothetical protein [Catellatospora sp. TT07R-123]
MKIKSPVITLAVGALIALIISILSVMVHHAGDNYGLVVTR